MPDISPRVLIGALIAWIVPLAVSFALVDPQTGIYWPNYWAFKGIMAGLAAAAAFFTYRWIAKAQPLGPGAPATYVGLNAVLDLALLVGLFGMAFPDWALTILPIYLVVFYGVWALVRR